MNTETIRRAALSLPVQERAELAEQLLSSLDALSEAEVEQLWFREAARVEHLEHVAYYEEPRHGLGARYLAAFEAAMLKVCAVIGVRRTTVRRFPRIV